MAYVAISGTLIERVKDKIGAMHRAELKTIGEFTFKFSNTSQLLDEALWGEHLSFKSQMPEHWMGKADAVRLKFKIGGQEMTQQVDVNGEYIVPPNFRYYDYYEVDIDHPELAAVKDWYTKKFEVDLRWGTVMSKVTGFLTSCKSLNEAVKLWPDITMYLHNDDIERMDVKRERVKESAAMEALKSLDTEALVGAAVIARLSGANV